MSRYSFRCPACDSSISNSKIPYGRVHIPCPVCGVWLEYAHKHTLLIWAASILMGGILSFTLGYRGWSFILATTCVTLLLYILGFFFEGLLDPPSLKQSQHQSINEDVRLHLTDKWPR